MNSPKSECEILMQKALPFAEAMLAKHGEFYPYGQAMDDAGRIVDVAAYDGRERPPSADLIKLIKQAFIREAKSKKYKATALVYDVRVNLPTSGQKSNAIAVALNHRDNYSVIVFFAYRMEAGKYIPGEVFAQKGEDDIFGKQ